MPRNMKRPAAAPKPGRSSWSLAPGHGSKCKKHKTLAREATHMKRPAVAPKPGSLAPGYGSKCKKQQAVAREAMHMKRPAVVPKHVQCGRSSGSSAPESGSKSKKRRTVAARQDSGTKMLAALKRPASKTTLLSKQGWANLIQSPVLATWLFLAPLDCVPLDCAAKFWRDRIDWRAHYLNSFGQSCGFMDTRAAQSIWKQMYLLACLSKVAGWSRSSLIRLGSLEGSTREAVAAGKLHVGLISDCCDFLEFEEHRVGLELQCSPSFWRTCIDWHANYVHRFGTPPFSLDPSVQPWTWKSLYLYECRMRLVPGSRAMGIDLKSAKRKLRCCGGVSFDGEGYHDVVMNGLRFRASFQHYVRGYTGDLAVWDDPEQDFAVWDDEGVVRQIGVCRPHLGTLEVPGRPELKGIRVGTSVRTILEKLGAQFEDISIVGSNHDGTLFMLEDHLPRVCFQLDRWDEGRVTEDNFQYYDEPETLRACLDYAVGMIVVE